jgi:site-specific DNA recombinase
LDGIVWQQVVELLEDPALIRQEIQRRLQKIQDSNPTQKRKEIIDREITRHQKGVEKLLDAYQEGLLELDELRSRMPILRKRSEALQAEFRSLEAITSDQQTFLRLAENIEGFLQRLRSTAGTMDVVERQKILRLVVKEILIHKEAIKIRHSIPVTRIVAPPGPSVRDNAPSYLLCSRSQWAALRNPKWSCLEAIIYHHTCP